MDREVAVAVEQTMAGPDRLDARYLACPLPVLKARKRLLGMAPGERLLVLATDPAALRDFPDFTAAGGHRLVLAEEVEPGLFHFLIERG